MGEGRLLWEPTPDRIARATITRFAAFAAERTGRTFADYDALWRWSVDDVAGFWALVWEFFDVRADGSPSRVLPDEAMPGARWFPDVSLSHPEHVFRDRDDAAVVIRHASEVRELGEWTWGDLRAQTARIRAGLIGLGVRKGDRVAAYMPNIPETMAAFLATASLGAVWSSAAPEFGVRSVVDRFAQIEPRVLLAVDGYRYNGKPFDRAQATEEIARETGARRVRFGYLDGSGWEPGFADGAGDLAFERVPFAHPLWILYSSGTTGLPKAIVHGHGGILLEHYKQLGLHCDLQGGDRLFWFSTTGWMMWNFLVGVLLTDASVILYDGSPGHPDMGVLWDLAERTGATCFGTSASFIASCMKAGVKPAAGRDLSRLRAVGSTGSPLAPEGFQWIYDEIGRDTWLFSTSGGTDVCSAFVGGVPTLPVYEGELQARHLGADVDAFDEAGHSVIDEVGELVIKRPLPSMPVAFWNDPDGAKLREAYFDFYPGVWRHGDWIRITPRGSAVISGRSDSTINRGGVRMGTSELYRAVLALPEVVDALVVDVPPAGGSGESRMSLFVVLREGAELEDALAGALRARIRADCSPRHVPDEIRAIAEIPRTLSGKVLEVPVKKILMGIAPEQAASRDSLANPASLDPFVNLARERGASASGA
jgi:acetoacetyl-CoA synthetase